MDAYMDACMLYDIAQSSRAPAVALCSRPSCRPLLRSDRPEPAANASAPNVASNRDHDVNHRCIPHPDHLALFLARARHRREDTYDDINRPTQVSRAVPRSEYISRFVLQLTQAPRVSDAPPGDRTECLQHEKRVLISGL